MELVLFLAVAAILNTLNKVVPLAELVSSRTQPGAARGRPRRAAV